MMDGIDLYLTCDKVHKGVMAQGKGESLDDCPYMDDIHVSAWRFGWKLGKMYALAKLTERVSHTLGTQHGLLERAMLAYEDAQRELQAEIPPELDIRL